MTPSSSGPPQHPGPLERHSAPLVASLPSAGQCLSLRTLPDGPIQSSVLEQPATDGLPNTTKGPSDSGLETQAGEVSAVLQEGPRRSEVCKHQSSSAGRTSHALTKVHLQGTALPLSCCWTFPSGMALPLTTGGHCSCDSQSPSLSWQDLQFPSPPFSFGQLLPSASLSKGQAMG